MPILPAMMKKRRYLEVFHKEEIQSLYLGNLKKIFCERWRLADEDVNNADFCQRTTKPTTPQRSLVMID